LKPLPPNPGRTGIPIHWLETGVKTIEIQHCYIDLAALLALIAGAKKIFASRLERRTA